MVAHAGTLARHVKDLSGKSVTDGARAQRRALLPLAIFEQLMDAALAPKAKPGRHPDAFDQEPTNPRLARCAGSSVMLRPNRSLILIQPLFSF